MPASGGPVFVDRAQVLRNFTRHGAEYAQADLLAREIDGRMQERLDYVRLTPEWIVDLGCGPGLSLPCLRQRYPQSRCLGVDRVAAMLPRQPRPSGWRRWLPGRPETDSYLLADAAALPIGANRADLAWSNLLLPWLEDPRALFAESRRILKVGGLLMFSTLGPDTLKELRAAFDDGHTHVQRFADMHDLGDMLVESGFADPVVDMEVITLTYESLERLFQDLRAAGAACAMQDRPRGLTGRRGWARMLANYEGLRRDGRLPATFEIIYGHAWKPEPRQVADGRSIIRFERPPR